MSTQQSNNESTGNAPTPAGGNNAKPKNEQDNGGGTNKPPNTKGKKTRNRKTKIRIKARPRLESTSMSKTPPSRISKTDQLTSTDL